MDKATRIVETPAADWRAVLYAGLLAGALDITAAAINLWVTAGRGPLWTLQSVAGGLYGRRTFEGGYATAALGLALHFFIALTAAAVYYLAGRRLRFLLARPLAAGALYGVLVWLFMNFVVLPLTPLRITYTVQSVIVGLLIHVFFVGWPIALTLRKTLRH